MNPQSSIFKSSSCAHALIYLQGEIGRRREALSMLSTERHCPDNEGFSISESCLGQTGWNHNST
jgi:hypothetical protein